MALNYAYAILGTAAVCTGMIMDEEVLVLYAFILFVALAYHYGSSVVDGMIRSEADKVSTEFNAFFDVQKQVLKTLIQYHVLQVAVISQIKELLTFSKGEISSVISAKKATLDATLANEMTAKLALLASKEQAIASSVQAEASAFVTQSVLDIFTKDHKDQKSLKEAILSENISKLEAM
jgi:hypothetical protein|tara:strand:+ start:977 stop:1513 length:537 start_codon:yes stop_codon:yes gene_type:complete